MTDLLYLGYISGVFGLKGEVKLITDETHLDKILKPGNHLYIDNKEYTLVNYHYHNNHHLVTFDGFEDINKVDELLKKDVFFKKSEISLKDNEYLYIELIGFDIIDDNQKIGVVEEILFNKKCTFIKSGNLIIPLIDKYFEKVDLANKKIIVNNSKELML